MPPKKEFGKRLFEPINLPKIDYPSIFKIDVGDSNIPSDNCTRDCIVFADLLEQARKTFETSREIPGPIYGVRIPTEEYCTRLLEYSDSYSLPYARYLLDIKKYFESLMRPFVLIALNKNIDPLYGCR